MVKAVCSIGTLHPWNIAGVGLDARVCTYLGVRHVAVIAGVSAHGSGAFAQRAVDADMVAAQLASLRDAEVGAYRLGALLSPRSVRAIAEAIAGKRVPVVCDPVIASSGGERLADTATAKALRSHLFRHCTLVTPNLFEASELCGFPVNDRATMSGAAHTLVERDRAAAALITGGHLYDSATDVLYTAGCETAFEGTRLPGGMRGTGCVLATAIAVELMRGADLIAAIKTARELVRSAIENAVEWSGERVWPW